MPQKRCGRTGHRPAARTSALPQYRPAPAAADRAAAGAPLRRPRPRPRPGGTVLRQLRPYPAYLVWLTSPGWFTPVEGWAGAVPCTGALK
ncbi:hypothetical protein GCM10027570_51380 [Streptomonospora sediminis]